MASKGLPGALLSLKFLKNNFEVVNWYDSNVDTIGFFTTF
jgi:hypothetical protein